MQLLKVCLLLLLAEAGGRSSSRDAAISWVVFIRLFLQRLRNLGYRPCRKNKVKAGVAMVLCSGSIVLQRNKSTGLGFRGFGVQGMNAWNPIITPVQLLAKNKRCSPCPLNPNTLTLHTSSPNS